MLNVTSLCHVCLYALVECERQLSLVRDRRGGSIHLHGVHQEAELVAKCLVAVRHPDLGHVGPPDVVALMAVLKVIWTQEVLFLLGEVVRK